MFRLFVRGLVLLIATTQVAHAQQSNESENSDESAVVEQPSRAKSEMTYQPRVRPFSERPKNFTVGLSAGPSGSWNHTSGRVSNSHDGISTEENREVSGAMGLILEYHQMPQFNWGFQVGLSIEGSRDIGNGSGKRGGESVVIKNSKGFQPKLRSETIYANAVYRWEKFYIPFGLNYSNPHYSVDGPVGDTEFSATGAVGGQLGVGIQINEMLGLELQSRATGMRLKAKQDELTSDSGIGYLSDTRVIGKFSF